MSSCPSEACRHDFRRQWHRLVIPCLFVVGGFVAFACRVPDGIWYAIPSLAFGLLVCTLLHGGVRLTRDGIEWYVLHPKWCYRRVPWGAVCEVRNCRLFQPGVALRVEPGRYEPWVWGNPRADRPLEIRIWTNGYVRGETLGAAIRQRAVSHLPQPAGERGGPGGL